MKNPNFFEIFADHYYLILQDIKMFNKKFT